MTNRRHKLIKAIIIVNCCALLLASCGAGGKRPQLKTAYTPSLKALVSDGRENLSTGSYSASAEELNTLKTAMKLLTENDEAALYMGKYYDIAVLDKKTSAIFYSNRSLYDEDDAKLSAEQKQRAYSQLILKFYRSDAKEETVYSFPESYDADTKDQVKVQVENSSVFVRYTFGTSTQDKILSSAFTPKTYEALSEKAKELLADKKLSRSEWGRFTSTYNHLVYKNLSQDDKKKYSAQYSNFEALGELYVLNPAATYIQLDAAEKVSKILGLTKGEIEAEEESAGGSASLESVVPPFEITLEYRLQGADLIVSADPSKIKEPKGVYLNKLYVLPEFGASRKEEEGYLLVPGGSGSIVNNAKIPAGVDRYDISFYGPDFALDLQKAEEVTEQAPFPVFGIKAGEKSVFAVAESGEAMGGVTAQLTNVSYIKNQMNPWFVYRQRSAIKAGNAGAAASADFVYSKNIPETVYSLRYHFLYSNKSDYSGMAEYYRTYLERTGAFAAAENKDSGLDIELLGAITVRQIKYGIPMEALSAVSSFEEAAAFAENLSKLGVNNAKLRYSGIFSGGLDAKAPYFANIEKVLGGQWGFLALLKRTKAVNIPVFPTVTPAQVYQKGGGLSTNRDLSRFLNKNYAVYSDYSPATGLRSESPQALLINPLRYGDILESFEKSYSKYSSPYLYPSALGDVLYSSYNSGSEVTREDSKQLTANALSLLKKKGYNLKLDCGNVYALPFSSSLVNVPLTSSDNRMLSASVPFTGMVLRGSIAFTGSALNRAGDYDRALLKAMENGAGLSYQLATGDVRLFSESNRRSFYSISAEDWQDEIVRRTKALWAFTKKTAGNTIVNHQILMDGVVKTVYSGGTEVYINYTDTEVTVEGVTLDPVAYWVK